MTAAPSRKRSAPRASAPDPWMSVKAAARTLGIAPQTVYSRAVSGHLVTQIVADRVFVSRASVEALKQQAA